MNTPLLTLALQIAAAGQLCVAVLNLFLPRLLGWRDDLAKMPLLIREVFQIHVWFISITLAIFVAITWRFAAEMNVNPVCRWLAGAISIFWGIRTVLQLSYYSSSHWRGIPSRTAVHVVLLAAYGCLTAVYGLAALGFFRG